MENTPKTDSLISPRSKALIFDFGGTLDTEGYHWFEEIFESIRRLEPRLTREQVYEAYVFAERELCRPGRITPDTGLNDIMVLKMQIILADLAHNSLIDWDFAEESVMPATARCLDIAEKSTRKSAETLGNLYEKYPMAVVSNYYGNLDTVLRENGLRGYFKSVLDSATIGVRKPNPDLFKIGCIALGFPCAEVTVTGDSLANDILPALSLGCDAILLCPGEIPEGIPVGVKVARKISDLCIKDS